jgi:hypothetical protein
MVFAPEGIGILTNDPFTSVSSGQAVRRYVGDFLDFAFRKSSQFTGANVTTLGSIWRSASWRVFELLFAWKLPPDHASELVCDVMYSEWGNIHPPRVTARSVVRLRRQNALSVHSERAFKPGCLLIYSPIPGSAGAWEPVLESIAALGVHQIAIKPHPRYDLAPLVSLASTSSLGLSFEILPGENSAEFYIENFRWEVVVGMYSSALYYAHVNFPDDLVLTGCSVLSRTLSGPHRKEAARLEDEFLKEVGSRIAGPPSLLLGEGSGGRG